MKERYLKPELGTKPYAQFENVFAYCSKNKNDSSCFEFPASWVPSGSSYSAAQNLGGHTPGQKK